MHARCTCATGVYQAKAALLSCRGARCPGLDTTWTSFQRPVPRPDQERERTAYAAYAASLYARKRRHSSSNTINHCSRSLILALSLSRRSRSPAPTLPLRGIYRCATLGGWEEKHARSDATACQLLALSVSLSLCRREPERWQCSRDKQGANRASAHFKRAGMVRPTTPTSPRPAHTYSERSV